MGPAPDRIGHGQVWWADLDKVRPVVVITRQSVADLLSRVLVAPVTTTVRGIPTEVSLGAAEGLAPDCVANLDNIQLISRKSLLKMAGRVQERRWPEFCHAMARVMSCPRR